MILWDDGDLWIQNLLKLTIFLNIHCMLLKNGWGLRCCCDIASKWLTYEWHVVRLYLTCCLNDGCIWPSYGWHAYSWFEAYILLVCGWHFSNIFASMILICGLPVAVLLLIFEGLMTDWCEADVWMIFGKYLPDMWLNSL